jgi:hypothetical protein
MRTTIRLNDDVLRRAKRYAVEEHTSFTRVIENALRLWLDGAKSPRKPRSLKVPSSGRGGLRPGVNLDNTSDLLERIEDRL